MTIGEQIDGAFLPVIEVRATSRVASSHADVLDALDRSGGRRIGDTIVALGTASLGSTALTWTAGPQDVALSIATTEFAR